MFSGIVSEIGAVYCRQERGSGTGMALRLGLCAPMFGLEAKKPVILGQSVLVSGVCLTLVEHQPQAELALFDLSPETLQRTTLFSLKEGDLLNLESSVCLGDPLDGHIVQGHVDDVLDVLAITPEGEGNWSFAFCLPRVIAPLVALKGSICLDGVSLTVSGLAESSFSVSVIPYTFTHTTFSRLQVGSKVNCEVDCLARYVANFLSAQVISGLRHSGLVEK